MPIRRSLDRSADSSDNRRMDLSEVPRHPVAVVAGKLKRTETAIRHLAVRHGIGTLLNSRLRLFSDADVEQLKAIVKAGPGRPRNPPAE